MVEHSIWAYPWDLHDIGVDRAIDSVAEQGVNTVSLATSYHAGRFLQPGNPKRKVYFPQDGAVYYRVDPARWAGAEIKPLEADIVSREGDYLAQLVERRDKGGPGVSCWTVCLHNNRLGMMHPDHVMRTCHGDPHFYALCPSSPAARAYVTGLVAEISHTYQPDRIELESPDFMVFDHGYHHEKDGLGLLPGDKFLLGLCFCQHCMAGAMADGIPAEGARREAAMLLDAAFARDLPDARFPDFPDVGPAAFAEYEDLYAYIQWRRKPIASLLSEIRTASRRETLILFIDFEGSWWGGVDLSLAAPHCDGILHCAYFADPSRIPVLLSGARDILGPDKTLIAGFQVFHPEVSGPDDLRNRVQAALPFVDGCNFYNLGLVPETRLPWIGNALAPD